MFIIIILFIYSLCAIKSNHCLFQCSNISIMNIMFNDII